MKAILNIVAICLMMTANCMGQVTFQKTYGGAIDETGYCVRQTDDGGYIVSGYTYTFSAGLQDVYLIKTDSIGVLLWTKSFGYSDNNYAKSIQQTSDRGYIITGGDESQSILVKLDSTGTISWRKSFATTGVNWGSTVQQTADGGYVLVGAIERVSGGDLDVYVIKTDSSGSLLWAKNYGGTALRDDRGESIQQTTDGGYIIVGTTYITANNPDVYIIKTDSIGNTLWTKALGGSNGEWGLCVKQTTDGGYIITGYTNSFGAGLADVYLTKLDSTGTLLWSKTFGESSSDIGRSVQQTSEGGFIVAGRTVRSGNVYIYLIRTNALGDTLWTKTFGQLNPSDEGYDVQQTSDGGFIITGSIGPGSNSWDVYLIKTDANGNSGCDEQIPATTVSVPATSVINLATIVSSPSTTVSSGLPPINNGGTETTICLSTQIQSEINNPQSAITISPNPSPGLFHISLKAGAAIVKAEVHNCIGEKVFELSGASSTSRASVTASAPGVVDLTKEAAGIYFYSVTLKDGTVAKGKLVKE